MNIVVSNWTAIAYPRNDPAIARAIDEMMAEWEARNRTRMLDLMRRRVVALLVKR